MDANKDDFGVIFVPEGTRAIAQIPLKFIEGTFKSKLMEILSGVSNLTEVTDNEYEVLREILPLCDVKFRILVGIPGVDSPRSFLAEDNLDRVISYTNLEFTPEKEESRFMQELEKEIGENPDDED